MNTKAFFYVPMMIVNMILLIGDIGVNLYLLFAEKLTVAFFFLAAASLLTLSASLLYLFRGYKKNAVGYYRMFLVLYALTSLINVFAAFAAHVSVLYVILFTAAFLLSLLLAVIQNPGENFSHFCGRTILVIFGVLLLLVLVKHGDYAAFLRALSNVILAVLMNIMVNAKYIDKAYRKGE